MSHRTLHNPLDNIQKPSADRGFRKQLGYGATRLVRSPVTGHFTDQTLPQMIFYFTYANVPKMAMLHYL